MYNIFYGHFDRCCAIFKSRVYVISLGIVGPLNFDGEQPRFIMADSVRVPEQLPEHIQAYLDQKKHALQEEALACDILLLHFCQDEIPEVTRVTFKSKNYDGCSTTHVTPFGGGTCFFLTQKLGTFSVGSIDRMYERVHRVIQAITCLYRSQREH